MPRKKVLYISGSLGLGHIIRDMEIAKELLKKDPEIEIFWLAAHPASMVLEQAGEKLHPDAGLYADDNIPAEQAAKGFHLNLLKYLMNAKKAWAKNVEIFKRVTEKEKFDLVIGDETYEIWVALKDEPSLKKAPFVMMYDFVGLYPMTKSPLERIGIYLWNRVWSKDYNRVPSPNDLSLFVGELEEVPDEKFGFMLPNRLDWAREICQFTGHVLPFDPSEYGDKATIRAKLGYGEEPLIVCSIGGTSVGKPLLELCGQTYPIIKEQIPDVRMILNCGPRLSPDSLEVPKGVEVKGYIPKLYEHLAAGDLAVVQGGGMVTLELTALRRPFLFFPIDGHFEQQVHVARRVARNAAGVKMTFSQTTPKSLAETVLSNLGKEITYREIPTNGAQKAAELISHLF